MNKRPTVFLDRDGVLNNLFFHKDLQLYDSPYNRDQVFILPRVLEALKIFKDLGYITIIITNQPGAAKKKISLDKLFDINDFIVSQLNKNEILIDDFFICPHHPDALDSLLRVNCRCRKPNSGLIEKAIKKHNININKSFMVGDSISDIEAGNRSGLTTILIGHLKCDSCGMFAVKEKKPNGFFKSLIDFALQIKNHQSMKTLYFQEPYSMVEKAKKIEDLQIEIYADGAEINTIKTLVDKPYIKGFTTNPTLIAKAKVINYYVWAKDVLGIIKNKSISFEVISDDLDEMECQARKIASWGDNIFVKIPIMNTKRESTTSLIKRLSLDGIKVNITAVMLLDQVREVIVALSDKTPAIISIFAGRIADTGRDPVPIMHKAKDLVSLKSNIQILWASPREVFNIFQANNAGTDIITLTSEMITKLEKLNYDLNEYSLDTVKMFYCDAKLANLSI